MSSPDLTDAEREAVASVLRTPRLSMGPELEAFEAALAERVGAKHALAVSSGTAALHLCVCAAGLGDGDLVITTPFSFVASANVLLYERAIPVFVDVDPQTGNLDPEQVAAASEALSRGGRAGRLWLPRRALKPRALKAILAVDVFGQPADYDRLVTAARRHDLLILEDASEAIGAEYEGRQAGMLGQAGVFAFYPNKQMTTGEGGAVVTDQDDWAVHMRALRNQGRARTDTWLRHTHLGFNYRMHEMSAALGRVQLQRLDELLERREQVAGWYTERLAEIAGVRVPLIARSTTRMSWFVYVVRLADAQSRQPVIQGLAERGIPSRAYFDPIHLQPYMVERFGYRRGDFPVAEELGAHSLALPFSGIMSEDQVERVCAALAEVLGRR